MKLLHKLLLIGAMAVTSGTGFAAPELAGIIRAIDTETQQLWIDEKRYRFPGDSSISNLAGGTDRAFDLAAGQHVRYSLTEDGEIDKLWVIPSDTRQQEQLNLRGDTNH